MGNELKLNSAEEAEVILIRLTPEEYPIAYANKVKCLMISGLSEEDMREMFLTGWAKDDLKSFCSYVGDTWNDWLLRPVATRIYDLVSYYGAEEIFGNSYRTYTAKEVCLSLHIKYMEEYETAC